MYPFRVDYLSFRSCIFKHIFSSPSYFTSYSLFQFFISCSEYRSLQRHFPFSSRSGYFRNTPDFCPFSIRSLIRMRRESLWSIFPTRNTRVFFISPRGMSSLVNHSKSLSLHSRVFTDWRSSISSAMMSSGR